MLKHLFFFLILFLSVSAFSQTASDAAVQLNAQVQLNPAQITLSWLGNASTTQYQVFRKLKSAFSWGAPLATLSGTNNTYVDNTAQVGDNYEYRVSRNGTNYVGHGYINSGIEVPEVEFRGKLILIVDSSIMTAVAPEITRYIKDVEGDGWEVIRHDVLRSASVLHVKDLILADYAIDSAQIKAVFLFGHVPVPYSGNINPDGHGDHLGAWPADVYYGDIDGVWTDQFVSSTLASPARTQNTPGDGKFDQSLVPGDVELQVGRVDFAAMPSFTLTEQHLLKNYLDKDHEYRKKIYVPIKRAVIDDNFGYFGSEAFAASGYKSIAPLVGTASITAADYFSSMAAGSYQWSYGCGGGSYTSAGGIGNTTNFASSNLQGVFTMLFGSYFGDWDSQNNFLRAALAQGKVLTNVWSGRPHYQFHHMGLGENIGYGLIQTQNNPGGLYYSGPTGITGKWIHNALLGDPTLRNDVLAPVSNVIATKIGYDCHITWSASTASNVIGYNIYVKNDSNTRYTKINPLPVTATSYTDVCLLFKGTYSYMVRALALENTPSGSYYNMSEGIADTAYNSSNIITKAAFTSTLSANTMSFTNSSINSSSSVWSFGDGGTSAIPNPVHTYSNNGFFYISLVSINGCHSDTSYQTITVNEVGISQLPFQASISIFPNPSIGLYTITGLSNGSEIKVYDVSAHLIYEGTFNEFANVDLRNHAAGIYYLQLKDGSITRGFKLIKQ